MTIEPDEPLIEGLTTLPEGALEVPAPPQEFRAALLAGTTRRVRARRRRGRLLRLAAAVLLFAAGVAVGTLRSQHASSADPGPGPEVRGPVEIAGRLPADPRDLEARLADATQDERARALRKAGDRYIGAARADPAAALYCYRRLLDEAPPGSETPGVDDGWLLTYLKLQNP